MSDYLLGLEMNIIILKYYKKYCTMGKQMAFDETKKLFREIRSHLKAIMAIFSAGSIIFLYWMFINLLSTVPTISDLISSSVFTVIKDIPIALLASMSFLNKNGFVNAIRNDWLALSIRTHIEIIGITLILTLARFVFIKKIPSEIIQTESLA